MLLYYTMSVVQECVACPKQIYQNTHMYTQPLAGVVRSYHNTADGDWRLCLLSRAFISSTKSIWLLWRTSWPAVIDNGALQWNYLDILRTDYKQCQFQLFQSPNNWEAKDATQRSKVKLESALRPFRPYNKECTAEGNCFSTGATCKHRHERQVHVDNR